MRLDYYRTMDFHRLSILGIGLLGGSLGLATREMSSHCKIIGYAHRRQTRNKALECSAVDHATDDLASAVSGADLVVLCTPVGTFESILNDISEFLSPGAIVTDVGSTKRSVVRLANERLGGSARFVGSHPMVGSEKRGVEHARADLFRGGVCIVTPDASTDADATRRIEGFWSDLGMHIRRMSPEEHDRAVGAVSHLPHAVAAALVRMQDQQALDVAGRGFLDATRIAAGDAGLWRDILLDNRDNLRDGLGALRVELDQLLKLLEAGQSDALAAWLEQAATHREKLGNRKPGEFSAE
jgi:prephenate dehydrogenase